MILFAAKYSHELFTARNFWFIMKLERSEIMSKLIKCNSCGKEVADTAKSCPGCGAKVKSQFIKEFGFGL